MKIITDKEWRDNFINFYLKTEFFIKISYTLFIGKIEKYYFISTGNHKFPENRPIVIL